MKGIILAGGTGTRLLPLTAVTSKQLLPVYDRPMVFYPLNTLISAGIRDILLVVSPANSGDYLNLLGSMFRKYDVRISFVVQKRPAGLPEAFILGEDFLDGGSVTLVLGDNIFEEISQMRYGRSSRAGGFSRKRFRIRSVSVSWNSMRKEGYCLWKRNRCNRKAVSRFRELIFSMGMSPK
jgi:dTDP-glucose pyrophosphorylase